MPAHGVRTPGRPPVTKCVKDMLCALLAVIFLTLFTGAAYAANLGMVADNESDELRFFDIESGAIIASLQGSAGQLSGDCAMSRDESTGFSSHANRQISVYQLTSLGSDKDVDISSIEISNAGVDVSLGPDGRMLVSTGAGIAYEPLSFIDIETRTELAVATPFLDHTSAEFCDDGTLLVTTTYGHSFSMPFDNAMYDARVDSNGTLSLSGNRLTSGAQPNNGSCAPGSRSGVLLDREGGLTSFTLPGLEKADFAKLHGETAVSAVYNRSGDRLYVRTTETVEAFDFNPLNGMMQASWIQTVPYSSEYFGIDQIAVDPDSGKLYVDGGQALLILNPENGRQIGSIHTGDATGVCFAQRPRHSPIIDVVYNAP
jgi:hypothetical protein